MPRKARSRKAPTKGAKNKPKRLKTPKAAPPPPPEEVRSIIKDIMERYRGTLALLTDKHLKRIPSPENPIAWEHLSQREKVIYIDGYAKALEGQGLVSPNRCVDFPVKRGGHISR